LLDYLQKWPIAVCFAIETAKKSKTAKKSHVEKLKAQKTNAQEHANSPGAGTPSAT
jgi:hypothetical protein